MTCGGSWGRSCSNWQFRAWKALWCSTPYRSAARDPSAAILAQPLAVDADRSIADVKELAVSATPLLSPNALSLIADCEGHQLLHPCKWPY